MPAAVPTSRYAKYRHLFYMKPSSDTDTAPTASMPVDYTGRSLLITGGTGSFGTTMAHRALSAGAARVRILSRDEAKQHAMRVDFGDPRLEFHLGDVRDPASVERATRNVDLVFHAAALKQVPSCEFFPLQAVMTNVLGSGNVLESARRNGVDSVVCLSTDKAVMPVNAMGMTKALMEKVAQAAARAADAATTVSIVRYGNVVFSRGSVVPLFIEQITSGQPVTVTEPTMTRFLMPLADCVDLVEFAFQNAQPGDIFIRKAPAATIGDLAQAVVDLFDSSATIKVIGIRHGEKWYETLATAAELDRADDLGTYYRVPMDSRDLNYADYFEIGEPDLELSGDYHSHAVTRMSVDGVRELLLTIPEVRDALTAWKAAR